MSTLSNNNTSNNNK